MKDEKLRESLAQRCVMCGKLVKPGIVTRDGKALLTMCDGCNARHIGGYYIGYKEATE